SGMIEFRADLLLALETLETGHVTLQSHQWDLDPSACPVWRSLAFQMDAILLRATKSVSSKRSSRTWPGDSSPSPARFLGVERCGEDECTTFSQSRTAMIC